MVIYDYDFITKKRGFKMYNSNILCRVLVSESPSPFTIRAMIAESGASQTEAAAALQVSYSTLRTWVTGTVKMPSVIWMLLQKVGLETVLEEHRLKCQRILKEMNKEG